MNTTIITKGNRSITIESYENVPIHVVKRTKLSWRHFRTNKQFTSIQSATRHATKLLKA